MIRRIVGPIGPLVLALLAAPLAAEAQPGKVWRIGYLAARPAGNPRLEAFRQGLRDLSFVEGQNVAIDYRSSGGRIERYPKLAAELVRLGVDLIVADGTAASLAARGATKTIPIVFVNVGDPVGAGLVTSLARPGGNITGLSNATIELAPKRLQLLGDVAGRKVSRVAVVFNPADASNVLVLGELKGPAEALGITLRPVEVRSPDDFTGAFSRVASQPVDALLVAPGPLMNTHAKRIVQLAARAGLPAMYSQKEFVEAGGLMSYATDVLDQQRRVATSVDKILKGANPADLPVELPTKFELVVNLKTAKALGLTIPQSILVRAEIIP